MIKYFLSASLLCFCLMSCVSLSTYDWEGDSHKFEKKPRNVDNICQIFREKPLWLDSAKFSYDKWGITVELMMAIIRHESSFRAAARPLDKNGKKLSSAYGYSQAIDGTWKIYQKENRKPSAKRTNFDDAIDFVGWYSSKSISRGKKVSSFDVNALYVFYHDGWEAFSDDKDRKIDDKVLKVADKVYKQTLVYHKQLKRCKDISNFLYGSSSSTWGEDRLPPQGQRSWF